MWTARRSKFFQIAFTCGGSYWVARTDQWGFHVERAAGFDPAGKVTIYSQGPNLTYRPYFPMANSPPLVRLHEIPGAMFASGITDVTYREDGTPASLAEQLRPGVFQTRPYFFTALHVTHPLATPLFCLPPSAWIALRLNRMRPRRIYGLKQLCLHCSYTLPGNPPGVCPECGTAVPAKAG